MEPGGALTFEQPESERWKHELVGRIVHEHVDMGVREYQKQLGLVLDVMLRTASNFDVRITILLDNGQHSWSFFTAESFQELMTHGSTKELLDERTNEVHVRELL